MISTKQTFKLEEATIADIQTALKEGVLTSVELTILYLNRIYFYDKNGIQLNAVPILNPHALEEAMEADRLRAEGKIKGPLHGIPFTVKDSYMVKGLTVASGSPAFANLIANKDSFIVQKIREAGGILIGKTNMPPMAAGGMQRGVYGRAESPYNADYLPAAWFSGSSNGSGTATAANFAAFGMAEETVSSGRSPASNNGLVAYTPSRGILSIRGNWPLFPVRDVVVPHTRTVEDLFTLLDVIAVEDEITTADFWRNQTAVELPPVSSIRPATYHQLKDTTSLKGKRIGVPKMYIGKNENAENPIYIRPSIAALWDQAAETLKKQGAEIVEVDFPVQEYYEKDEIYLTGLEKEGYLPKGWMIQEWEYLNAYAAEEFLQYVGDPNYPSWKDIDPSTVFPNPPNSVDERRGRNNAKYKETIAAIKEGVKPIEELPSFAEAMQGLERARKELFEDWMAANQLDFIVFPANCNIGKADADICEQSYDEAWENGNYFSNMNYSMRHLGIPSVSVCMGTMNDTKMPVNLTFIGPAYSDNELLRYAYHYEQASKNRKAASRTPSLEGEVITRSSRNSIRPEDRKGGKLPVILLTTRLVGGILEVAGQVDSDSGISDLRLFINGQREKIHINENHFSASIPVAHYLPPAFCGEKSLALLVFSKNTKGSAAGVWRKIPLSFLP